MTVLAPPLDAISRQARPYPAHLLAGLETGLCLFSAAFHGHNDVIHFARNNLRTTCVDTDTLRLDEMRKVYPVDWSFVTMDAWEFATATNHMESKFDAVSVDTFTGHATDRSLNSLDLWCSIATDLVTCTFTERGNVTAPDGWVSHLFPRTEGVYWLVLTPC